MLDADGNTKFELRGPLSSFGEWKVFAAIAAGLTFLIGLAVMLAVPALSVRGYFLLAGIVGPTGQVVAVDGQQMRGTQEKTLGKQAINMVSAWACENHLVLGQRPVLEGGSEITTLPELLKLLELAGCIVTVEHALGCQVEVAQAIRDSQADYLLAVKGNQGTLHEDIEDLFKGAEEVAYREVAHDHARTVNKGASTRALRTS